MSIAPFVLIFSYTFNGVPAPSTVKLFVFRVDQISLDACEQSKAAVGRDFPAAVSEGRIVPECKMNIPDLYDPEKPCPYPYSYYYASYGDCPQPFVIPAAGKTKRSKP